jgi:hypothetical protein
MSDPHKWQHHAIVSKRKGKTKVYCNGCGRQWPWAGIEDLPRIMEEYEEHTGFVEKHKKKGRDE